MISSSLLSRDSVSLDSFLNASNQLGRYVEDSCGPGYPLLTTFTGLVSDQQLDDLEAQERPRAGRETKKAKAIRTAKEDEGWNQEEM